MKLVSFTLYSHLLMLGFSLGTSERSQVIINFTTRGNYKSEPGRQEWISICADENCIEPLIIYKGENFSIDWIRLMTNTNSSSPSSSLFIIIECSRNFNRVN